VDRPRLLPREVETLEQLEHPALAVADPEALLDQGAQVAGAPRHAAVPLQVRAAQDERLEGGLPTLIERAGPAGAGPVAQAVEPFRVVAVDPVAERLAGHPGEPCGLLPRQAVALAAGEAAQRGRVAVVADRQGCGHGGISEDNAAATPQASD
jgi:hypothetical protein